MRTLENLERINYKRLFGLVLLFVFFVFCLKSIVKDNLTVILLVLLFVIMLATSTELKYIARIFRIEITD